ncbi:MAG TPA: hypothetical protein VEA41_02300 [Salinarimonas sp.]|nr:hypothetical protein [Salinarimonas sp.]
MTVEEAPDPRSTIAEIEARIEELADAAERSRKLVLAGRLAGWGGGILLVLVVTGVLGRAPGAFVLGLTALLGGIALAGSSGSTVEATQAEIADLERRRAAMIDGIGLRVVAGGRA